MGGGRRGAVPQGRSKVPMLPQTQPVRQGAVTGAYGALWWPFLVPASGPSAELISTSVYVGSGFGSQDKRA